MTEATKAIGFVVISHGSPRADANQRFTGLVQRVAARLGSPHVLPAFSSIARPNIADQVAVLGARGLRRIVLLPYFLHSGQHVTVDIPALLDECRRQFPPLTLELLPTLENDPAVEDVVVERLVPWAATEAGSPGGGAAIAQRSDAIIDQQLGAWAEQDDRVRRIVRRVVQATADVSFARTLRIHPQAIENGLAALAAGKPVLCDVKMLQAGLTRVPGEVVCASDHEEAAVGAGERGGTRAAAAMELLAPRLDGAVVAVGHAPAALWKVMELARAAGRRPALVVGLPVGFVGAREAKLALLESGLCYLTNTTPRGGSPVAAAALNALATLLEEPRGATP